MTTIAWDGSILAADKRINCGNSLYRTAVKIYEVKGGHVGCAGDLGQINAFMRWYREGCKKKAPNLENFEAIMVVDGKVTAWDGDQQIAMDFDAHVAVGSGWRWAAAAMDFGRTAIEAVEYASTRDNYTGCGVDSVTAKRARAKNRGRVNGTK